VRLTLSRVPLECRDSDRLPLPPPPTKKYGPRPLGPALTPRQIIKF
jgi:hypothetical protein